MFTDFSYVHTCLFRYTFALKYLHSNTVRVISITECGPPLVNSSQCGGILQGILANFVDFVAKLSLFSRMLRFGFDRGMLSF